MKADIVHRDPAASCASSVNQSKLKELMASKAIPELVKVAIRNRSNVTSLKWQNAINRPEGLFRSR